MKTKKNIKIERLLSSLSLSSLSTLHSPLPTTCNLNPINKFSEMKRRVSKPKLKVTNILFLPAVKKYVKKTENF